MTIDRPESGENFSRESVDEIVAVPTEGRLLWVFTPGTRTPGYKPGIPKRGVAMFARRSGAPTIPAAIKGTDRLSDRHVTVKFGGAIEAPVAKRDDKEYLERLMVVQQRLFDSIPHSHYYLDPRTEAQTEP